MSFADLIHAAANRQPDHPAILGEDSMVSYKELTDQVDAACALLLKHQVKAGDTVALGLPQAPYWQTVLLLGALRAGARPVLLGARPQDEIPALGPVHVVCAAGAALARLPGLRVIGVTPKLLNALRTTRMVKGLPDPAAVDASTGCAVLGGLNRPRAMLLGRDALQARVQATATAHGIDGSSRVLIMLGSGVGHALECQLAVFSLGATLVLPNRPADAARLMVSARVDRAILAPDVLGAMLQLGQTIGDAATRRMSLVGAPLPRDAMVAIQADVAADARQLAWAPELGVFASLASGDVPAKGICLGSPLEGVILEPMGQPAAGQDAPLHARTPWMATAYLDGAPAEGPRGLVEGWHLTGLIGAAGPAGLWPLSGSTLAPAKPRRAAGKAASGRQSAWSRGDLENAIAKLDDVSESCVLSHPLPQGGSVPVIVYAGQSSPDGLTPRIQALLGQGALFHLIRVNRMPRKQDGGIARAALAKVLEPKLAAALQPQPEARAQAAGSAS
jgi:acyl-coenzyme A synthetase/AMP-(fatty) acid ligase